MTQGQGRKPKDRAKHIKEKLEKVQAFLRTGVSINNACRAGGINPNTYYNWKQRAEKGEEPYASLWEKVEDAIAECEAVLAGRVFKAGKDDWKANAWILERRYPDSWTKQSEVKVEAKTVQTEILDEASIERLEELEQKIKESNSRSDKIRKALLGRDE